MKLEDLKLGSLYCFPARSKSCYKTDAAISSMLYSNTPFVLLEIHQYDTDKWLRFKILASNGEVWYTDVSLQALNYIRLATNDP